MPKIQAEDTTQMTEFRVKLRTDVQAKLAAYGVYLNPNHPSSATHVLTESFSLLISDDKEFAEFWKQRHGEFVSGKSARQKGTTSSGESDGLRGQKLVSDLDTFGIQIGYRKIEETGVSGLFSLVSILDTNLLFRIPRRGVSYH